jgi:predicted metal-dependent hydrolase
VNATVRSVSSDRLGKAIDVKLRRMRFGLSRQAPKHWVGGNKFLTHFFNAMSVVFPEGEKFFIEAVREFEESVVDPTLRQQIRGFVAQEGHHTLQHRLLNELVASQGVDMARYDAGIGRFLALLRQRKTAEERLGITCALEHFTAIMGNQLLSHPESMDGVDPAIAALWRWHAIEETEHKAVAFDVLRAVSGRYVLRARTQVSATLLFFPILHLIQLQMMRDDPAPTRLSDVLSGLDYMWGRKGYFRRMLGQYFNYYKPSFHPWDHDNRALIERWKQEDEPRYRVSA